MESGAPHGCTVMVNRSKPVGHSLNVHVYIVFTPLIRQNQLGIGKVYFHHKLEQLQTLQHLLINPAILA